MPSRVISAIQIGVAARAGIAALICLIAVAAQARTYEDQAGLQARLEASIKAHAVPGASVAIYEEGKLLTAAAGVVNLSTQVPMTTDTVMHVGSITKTFTTTLIMQLVDDGLVKLDDHVSGHLPDLRLGDRDALESMTVRMLLNHTNGIDGNLLPNLGHDAETLANTMTRFAGMGLLHAPGEDGSYSNAGMVMAGYLAQRVRGESWYRLMKAKIFAPLGLVHSDVLPEDALLHRASVGHIHDPVTGKLQRTSHTFLPLGYAPAGTTLMMSASDLMTFVRTHMSDGLAPNGDRLLSADSARAMRTVSARSPAFKGLGALGLGWMIYDNGVIHHGGGGPGILSWTYWHPEKQSAIVILTNSESGMAVVDDLCADWLAAIGVPKPAEAVEPDPLPAGRAAFVGAYENISSHIEVYEAQGKLYLRGRSRFDIYDNRKPEAELVARLEPVSATTFRLMVAAKGGDQGEVAYGTISFARPQADGRMQFIVAGGRYVKRQD